MDVREDETIAVQPFGVLGVECHEFVEEDMGHRGQTHRSTWMSRVGLESGIDLQKGQNQQLRRKNGCNVLTVGNILVR